MAHKFRETMVTEMTATIWKNERYFTVETTKYIHITQKSGRGSKTKPNVMIMLESMIIEDFYIG